MSEDTLVLRPKRLKGDDGYKIFSIRIKEDTVAQIDKLSEQTGRSRNELIGTFLDFALQRCTVQSD